MSSSQENGVRLATLHEYKVSNIYVAKYDDALNDYEAPVQVLGAKNIEVSFEITENKISADDKVVWANNILSSGSGR